MSVFNPADTDIAKQNPFVTVRYVLMNKNTTDIRCVNDDCLLCKNSKGNYCITDFDYNDLFDSNVSVMNDDICSVSKGGIYFAVARNKNITVIDTKINQKVEIQLDNDIFTVCFVNDISLFYSEMSNIDDINSNYALYIYDLKLLQRKFLNKIKCVSLNDFYCNQDCFTAVCETLTKNEIFVQKFNGETLKYSLNELVPAYLSNTVSFGDNGKKFLCLSRKSIFKKTYVYYVDIEQGKSNKILSLNNRDLRGLPKCYVIYFLNETYFAVRSRNEINIYDFAKREIQNTYKTTNLSVCPAFIKDLILTFSDGTSLNLTAEK